jgi:hypothetical protein
MKLEKQIPWRIPPRAPVARDADNSIALSTAQILQIAGILGPAAEDELVTARSAWNSYQSTRERDAVYRQGHSKRGAMLDPQGFDLSMIAVVGLASRPACSQARRSRVARGTFSFRAAKNTLCQNNRDEFTALARLAGKYWAFGDPFTAIALDFRPWSILGFPALPHNATGGWLVSHNLRLGSKKMSHRHAEAWRRPAHQRPPARLHNSSRARTS